MSHSTNGEDPVEAHIETSSLIETDVNLKQEETSNFIEQINCEINKTLDLPQPVDSTLIATANENISEENTTEVEQEEGKLAILGYFATLLFFFLYLADILSDMFLALSFCLHGNYRAGCVVLLPVYLSSFATMVLEMATNQDKTLKYRFLGGFIVFIFNLTGVVLYLQIICMLRRKLKKKSYNNTILETKLHTMKILKVTEAITEACPQIIVQTLIVAAQNEDITWLQYVSVATSTLGIIFSLVGYLVTFTNNYPNISLFGKIIKYLWLAFDTAFFTITVITVVMTTIAGILGVIFTLIYIVILSCRAYLYKKIRTENDSSQENGEFIYISMSYFTFELSCYNFKKAILARLIAIITVILTTIQWYYYQNKIAMYLPFLFDLINYVSILCFTLGLVVVILVIVQIILVSRVRCEENVDKHRLFFCN